MSLSVTCDACGEIIDQSASYYTAQVTTVQMIDGQLVSGGTVQRDYHTEHLPTAISMGVD